MFKRTLTIKFRSCIHVVPMNEIIYMEKEKRRIRLHTQKTDLVFYSTFNEVLTKLDHRFTWCHRSYILNLDRIAYLKDKKVGLDDETELFFGKATFYRLTKEYESYAEFKSLWIVNEDKRRGLSGRASKRE